MIYGTDIGGIYGFRFRFRFIYILVTDVTGIGPKNIDCLIVGPLLIASFTNVEIYEIIFFFFLSHEQIQTSCKL